jgi:NADH-quinone oxidoreductase subunit I
MAKGMATVMRFLLRGSVTEDYPWGAKVLPERSRTSFALPRDENGKPLCKSCLLCERTCPDGAIKIESEKRADGPGRELKRFTIDLGLCMYCGICVEGCTSSGLHHTGDFENAVADRDGTYLVLYEAAETDSAAGQSADDKEPRMSGAAAPDVAETDGGAQ